MKTVIFVLQIVFLYNGNSVLYWKQRFRNKVCVYEMEIKLTPGT